MSNPLAPLIGACVWAWMPEAENVLVPGPKLRPTLILEADDRGVLVAYGTSQKTNVFGLGEFVVTPAELEGLSKPTKFCLRKAYRLPFNKAFFLREGQVKVAGILPVGAKRKLALAAEEAGLL